MSDDDWLSHAMNDDSAVVEILMRLKRPWTSPPSPAPALQLDWSVRQRRSRQVIRKKSESTRASPTTPLSWSGATSASGGGGVDGSEESSRPPSKPIESARSKVSVTSETNTGKRSRKKKTLAELRDEEKLLLKESRDLKDEIATLRKKVEEQRARNERFKKLKHDVLPGQDLGRMADGTRQQSQQSEVSGDAAEHQSLPNGFSKASEIGIRESIFSLPDLNLPLEDDNNNGIS